MMHTTLQFRRRTAVTETVKDISKVGNEIS